MSKSVNQVTLLGNLIKDPVLKYTPSGTAVINFAIATNRSYKDKTTDEWKEIPEFTNVVFWGKSAEIINQYCKKGNKIYVQGRLQTRSWDDPKTNTKRYMTEVVGNEFTLLTPRPQQGATAPPPATAEPQVTTQQAEEIFNPPPKPEPLVKPALAPAPTPAPAPAQTTMEEGAESFEQWMGDEEEKNADIKESIAETEAMEVPH